MIKFRYIIISPVWNEEESIEKTIKSVISQTIKPVQWIIVNDGSTDRTEEIIRKWMENCSFITLVNLKKSGYSIGGKIINAFQEGIKRIKEDYDFIVKLDGDLSFSPDFFERLLKKFQNEPKLGIASGIRYIPSKNGLQIENKRKSHAIGACKTYRKECLEEIKGIIPELGWDTVDLIRARMKGWLTSNYKELKLIHYHKPDSRGGILKRRIWEGKNSYKTGYHYIFAILRGIYHIKNKPYFIGGILMTYGYFDSLLRRERQIVTPKEKRFFQKEQWKNLIKWHF